MKNPILYVIMIVLIVGVGAFFVRSDRTKTTETTESENQETPEHIVKEKAEFQKTAGIESDTKQYERYVDYSKTAFDAAKGKKRVYFFHANWCPICKVANAEFISQHDRIPADVMLFKTDYEGEKELKKQYGVTYQHIFVYVDENGKVIKIWNGGGIAELIANTK